ncbi:Protein kinase domain-containing protein [Forsythia ovata]|uniref:Protein kinase domain-containing protein n=1 Tax=Forsythia ovata TaxID=205694 RepID=A0ABD1W863_9LAMI
MTTTIAIEDVRKEVKILRALTGYNNLIQFYDAYEDHDNVYIVMEGGKYTEDDAKTVIIQILNVVAFCHLQVVVHRDLKPENVTILTHVQSFLPTAIQWVTDRWFYGTTPSKKSTIRDERNEIEHQYVIKLKEKRKGKLSP